MLVKARRSKSNEWGFLEKYEVYRYHDTGYVRALCSVTREHTLAPVYAYRGDEFIPLVDIDSEVGIEKYIKAKKPLYAKVKEGFLVVLKAEVNFVTKEFFPEKSSFEFYSLNGELLNPEKGLPFKKVLEVPKEFENVVKEPLRILGESFGNREKFLRSRTYG